MLSVVLPTFNRWDFLKNALYALVRQEISQPVEFLVIDSGDDPTGSLIADCFPGVRYLHIGSERNRALLRNRGAELACGNFLLFMDNDMIAPQGYLEGHLRRLQDNDRAVVLGRRLSLEDFSDEMITDSGGGVENLARLPWIDDVRAQDIRESGGDFSAIDGAWRFCYSHGLSLSRDLFFRAGGFDEQFGLNWGFEDVELGYRLFLQGAEFILLDGLDVFHQPHEEQSAGNLFQADLNREIFRSKHPAGAVELVSCFGPNIGLVLSAVEQAATAYPSEFLPSRDATEDICLGCYLQPGQRSLSAGVALGVYLPPDFPTGTLRIVRGFFRLPHMVQCFILNTACQRGSVWTVESLSSESRGTLLSLLDLLGIVADITEGEKTLMVSVETVTQNRILNIILPGFSQPESRTFFIHLVREIKARGGWPIITDLEGKPDFSREETLFSGKEDAELTRMKLGYYGPLGGRFIVAENELFALSGSGPLQEILVCGNRGLVRAEYMLPPADPLPGCLPIPAESIAGLTAWFGFRNVASFAAGLGNQVERDRILVFMLNGYHEDNLPGILSAFESFQNRDGDLKLVIKIAAFEHSAENAYIMHNRSSRMMNLWDIRRKKDYDVFLLREEIRVRGLSERVEILDTPLSVADRWSLYRGVRGVLALSGTTLVPLEAFEALGAGVPLLVHHEKIIPEPLGGHPGIIRIKGAAVSYTKWINQPFHPETFGYQAFTADAEPLAAALADFPSRSFRDESLSRYPELERSAQAVLSVFLPVEPIAEKSGKGESADAVCHYSGV